MDSPRIRISYDIMLDDISIEGIFDTGYREVKSMSSSMWYGIVKMIQQDYANVIMKYMCELEDWCYERDVDMPIYSVMQHLNNKHKANGLKPYDLEN